MTKPNSIMINKLLSTITEGEEKRERKRICRTAAGGRARGGMDPAVEEERAEEEHGPDDGSRVRQ
jgi:hypothetical protein